MRQLPLKEIEVKDKPLIEKFMRKLDEMRLAKKDIDGISQTGFYRLAMICGYDKEKDIEELVSKLDDKIKEVIKDPKYKEGMIIDSIKTK